MKKNVLFLLFFIVNLSFSQVQTFYVHPTETDAGYSAAEDSMAISRNTGSQQQNKLFLFLGGTGSSSYDDYNALRLHAASLGFDFINLAYRNDVAAASLSNDPDSLAFDKYRQEIGFGTPNSNAVTVDTFNSIHTRTLKILNYLDAAYPAQNWGQYLLSTNSVDWPKVIIGGHSQGAGHAAYFAKQFQVERVLMFSGPNDYSDFYSNSAHWIRQPGFTPYEYHYAYLSLNDEAVDFSKQFVNLTGLDMLINDDTTLVDNLASPFLTSRCLYTIQPPGLVILNHNVPIKLTLKNKEVWTYMLTSTITFGLEEKKNGFSFSVSPNPATDIFRIVSAQNLVGKSYILKNIKGQEIAAKKIESTESLNIDVSNLESGVYFLTIENQTTKLIKR